MGKSVTNLESNIAQVKGYPAWVFGGFAGRLIMKETVSKTKKSSWKKCFNGHLR